MGFLEWLSSLLSSYLPKDVPTLTSPRESVEIMKKIEKWELAGIKKELSELMERVKDVHAMSTIIAKNQIHLLQAYKQQEEMIVAIATMHEEMLYQIEQGKVMIVKPQTAAPQRSEEPDDDSDPSKSKKNGQWN